MPAVLTALITTDGSAGKSHHRDMLTEVKYWFCVIMLPKASVHNPLSYAPSGRSDSSNRSSGQELHRCDSRESRSGVVSSPPRVSYETHAAVTAVRHLVSGNRSRYVDGEYDLDLTYITRRLIAMAFPGEDLLGPFSSIIRNDLRLIFADETKVHIDFFLVQRQYF